MLRNGLFLFFTTVMTLLVNASPALAYSYSEAEDPIAVIFREGVVAAKNGKWEEAKSKSAEGISLTKRHMLDAAFLTLDFELSTKNRDVNKTAALFAQLVYMSIREKLEVNYLVNTPQIPNAKARLFLARKNYLDVLDGNIKKQNLSASISILSEFDSALTALGNPGLFGVGAKPLDPLAYKKSVESIEAIIEKIFPDFANAPDRLRKRLRQ